MATERDRYPVRRSPRLGGFDYRRSGVYFVTVCTVGRRELFGHVQGGRMQLGPLGQIVAEELTRISKLRQSVRLDASVVMPNHLHAVFVLARDGAVHLGAVVNQFKASVSRRVRAMRGRGTDVWQRGYYERIVRDDRDLEMTREYIAANPSRWAEDRENLQLG